MKGVKNLLSIFVIFLIVLVITIPSLIYFLGSGFASIVMIPDGAIVFDNGFSEEIYNSGIEFEDDFDESFQYEFFPSMDPNSAVSYIETLFDNGAETIVSTSNTIIKSSIIEYFNQNPDSTKHAIIIDDAGFTVDAWDNILSINYLANEASFIVGVISGIYISSLIDDLTTINSIDINAGTWGGLPVPGVVQMLSGFEQGINWFNYYFFGTDVYGNKVSEYYDSEDLAITPLNVNPGVKIDLYGSNSNKATNYNTNPNHSNYYSNSFNVGEGETSATNLIENGSKILFPVAGGQMVDALSIANKLSRDNQVQVIGVDTDKSLTYQNSPDYLDQLLTSAIKDVKKSTYNALAYIFGYSNSENANPNYNSSNFIENYEDGGWAYYSQDDLDGSGNVVGESDKFVGTMENGGVGVTGINDSTNLMNQSWNKLFDNENVASILNNSGYASDNLQDFLLYSMDMQQLAKNDATALTGVESNSNTFVDPINESNYYVLDKTDPNYIHDSSNEIMVEVSGYSVGLLLPWIPNWSLYIE